MSTKSRAPNLLRFIKYGIPSVWRMLGIEHKTVKAAIQVLNLKALCHQSVLAVTRCVGALPSQLGSGCSQQVILSYIIPAARTITSLETHHLTICPRISYKLWTLRVLGDKIPFTFAQFCLYFKSHVVQCHEECGI